MNQNLPAELVDLWRCGASDCRPAASMQEYVAKFLTDAASDGDTENVAVPLKMALSLEGIAYQTTRRRC
jgi:hypothetical protein